MTRIYLVRHAQSEGNLYRRAHGMYNSKITPRGYDQLAALKGRFASVPLDRVFTSPLYRARTTAQALCAGREIPVQVLQDLHEVNCGPWEDRTWGDIRYHDGEQLDNFNNHFERWHVPGAETPEEVRARMLRAADAIVAQCPGRTVAAVSHGMACRILLGTLEGMSLAEISERFPHGDNTAVSLIEHENGRFRVVFANDASHLSDAISTFAHQSWWRGKGDREITLRFVPLQVSTDAGAAVYQMCRAEGWMSSHGSMQHFDGAAFLARARRSQQIYPEAVLAAYYGDAFAGLLELDTETDSAEGAGRVAFAYMTPEYRKHGAGIQLVGEAVSRFRQMGRARLRLRCAAENQVAQNFYRRCGFHKIGVDDQAPVALDILELPIGFEGP